MAKCSQEKSDGSKHSSGSHRVARKSTPQLEIRKSHRVKDRRDYCETRDLDPPPAGQPPLSQLQGTLETTMTTANGQTHYVGSCDLTFLEVPLNTRVRVASLSPVQA